MLESYLMWCLSHSRHHISHPCLYLKGPKYSHATNGVVTPIPPPTLITMDTASINQIPLLILILFLELADMIDYDSNIIIAMLDNCISLYNKLFYASCSDTVCGTETWF